MTQVCTPATNVTACRSSACTQQPMRSARSHTLGGLRIALRYLVAAAIAFAAFTTIGHPVAHADEDCPPNTGYQPECQYRPFYTPPNPLPAGAPGDLIRTEPSRIALDPAGHGNYSGTGTRIMYQSIDGRGQPVAVTGTYFEPDR